jgi:hypothetical protein
MCPICETEPIFDSEGPIMGVSDQCECCGERICRGCSYIDMDFWMNEDSDFPEYLKKNIDPSWDVVCNNCVANIELDYIDEVPYQDLPLFINQEWYFPETSLPHYQKALKHPKTPKKD